MTQAAGPLARVVAAGVYASGSGYPNGAQTLALLERASVATVVDCSLPMPPDRRLWRELRGPLRAALAAFGLLLRNGRSVLRARAIARATRAIVFVRHPPHLALLWFALVPRFLRPQLVVEAYLFAWETLANR
ncbi:MAG TPA: hypothetical protein VFO79_16880, partial [Xanthomonadales bacterium]|nr:hypothetical protein [Xanthomonadales bacterium]